MRCPHDNSHPTRARPPQTHLLGGQRLTCLLSCGHRPPQSRWVTRHVRRLHRAKRTALVHYPRLKTCWHPSRVPAGPCCRGRWPRSSSAACWDGSSRGLGRLAGTACVSELDARQSTGRCHGATVQAPLLDIERAICLFAHAQRTLLSAVLRVTRSTEFASYFACAPALCCSCWRSSGGAASTHRSAESAAWTVCDVPIGPGPRKGALKTTLRYWPTSHADATTPKPSSSPPPSSPPPPKARRHHPRRHLLRCRRR